MRIFAIAEFLLAAQREIHALGEAAFELHFHLFALQGQALEVHGDDAVVARGHGKNLARQLQPQIQCCFTLGFKRGGDASIVGRVGDHGDAFEILSGGTQHGGTADINIFDQLFGRKIFLGGGGFERIEVHDDQVDRGNAVFSGLLLIVRIVAAVEQTRRGLSDAAFSRGRRASPANS